MDAYFGVPRAYQHRVLFWAILGVIVLRALMIMLGATLAAEFSWILYVFGAFLPATGLKMLFVRARPIDLACNPLLHWLGRRLDVTDRIDGNEFRVRGPDPANPRAPPGL